MTDETKTGRIADLPLDERRAMEVERDREIAEGLTRRHLANAEYARAYATVQFDRILRMGRG